MKTLNYSKYQRNEDQYTVHMFTSGAETFLTNAYLIESESAVVAIDSMMVNSDATVLRALIDSIGKPLVAIFVTHGHPDHYNGVGILLNGFSDIPVISTKGVHASICKTDDIKEKKWRPHFGDDWPSQRVLPNKLLLDGSTINFDGVKYSIHELGAAESDSDLYIIVGDEHPVVFVGDVVFNNVHGFMSDGHSQRWTNVLKKLSYELVDIDLLFTGHGQPGNPLKLIELQLLYLSTYKNLIVNIAQGNSILSEAQKQRLEDELCAVFPQYELIDFIQLGADAVATEIV